MTPTIVTKPSIKESKVIKSEAQKIVELYNDADSLKEYIENMKLSGSRDYNKNLTAVVAASSVILGLTPRIEQIQGVLALGNSCIVEQDTGEGKTLVTALAACGAALAGAAPVHVVTSSEYLSRRDFNIMKPLFDFLEIKSSNPSSTDSTDKRRGLCEDSSIIYSTIPALIHDLMHYQYYRFSEDYIDRELLLVDEADLSLLDQAIAPFSIHNTKKFNVEDFHKTILKLKDIIKIRDVSVNRLNKTCILNQEGIAKIGNMSSHYSDYGGAVLDIFLKSFFLLDIGQDYIIDGNSLYFLVENRNGSAEKTPVNMGYDIALRVKHNLSLQNIKSYPARIMSNKMTFMEFTTYYSKIAGLTASGSIHAREFKEFYDLEVIPIQRSFPLDRREVGPILFFNNSERNKDIKNIIQKNSEAANIVACNSEKQAEAVGKFFETSSIEYTFLNLTENYENKIENTNAGSKGSVTVVTPSFARGVDIVPDSDVPYMNLILAGPMPTLKTEYQMKGRISRQGAKGIVYTLISTEDSGVEFDFKIKNTPGAAKITKLFSRQIRRQQEVMAEAEFISRKGLSRRTEILEKGRLMWLACKEQTSRAASIEDFLEAMEGLFGTVSSKERILKESSAFTENQENRALPQLKSLVGTSFNRAWVTFLNEIESFADVDIFSRVSGVDYNTYYSKIEKAAIRSLRENLYKESSKVLDLLQFS